MSKSRSKAFTPVTAKQIEGVLALLRKAHAPLIDAVVLDTTARRRALKLRHGAHKVVPAIAVLAEKHGLEMPSMPIADMTSKMEHAQRLREVLGAVTVFQKLLADEILSSESDGWRIATSTYAILRRAAKSRPDLAIELSPVEQWFRISHRGARASAVRATVAPTA